MNYGAGRAQVAVLAMDFRALFKGSFGLQMILQRSHNVTTGSGHGLVLKLGFRLVRQRSGSQSQAGGSSVVGSWFAPMAAAEKERVRRPKRNILIGLYMLATLTHYSHCQRCCQSLQSLRYCRPNEWLLQ